VKSKCKNTKVETQSNDRLQKAHTYGIVAGPVQSIQDLFSHLFSISEKEKKKNKTLSSLHTSASDKKATWCDDKNLML
jgi:hypothetical protein